MASRVLPDQVATSRPAERLLPSNGGQQRAKALDETLRGIARRYGTRTAYVIAMQLEYLIIDTRASQSTYALTDHLVHSDPIVQRFERSARARLKRGFSLDDAAKATGPSKRTLARHMQRVLGKSALSYFHSVRVERAVHVLRTTNASVEEVDTRVGYNDGATLRALLRRRLNIGMREIRRTA
jgi:transcriptional regulator GlxA family with amidase domain